MKLMLTKEEVRFLLAVLRVKIAYMRDHDELSIAALTLIAYKIDAQLGSEEK